MQSLSGSYPGIYVFFAADIIAFVPDPEFSAQMRIENKKEPISTEEFFL
jgi:hypothetical protein